MSEVTGEVEVETPKLEWFAVKGLFRWYIHPAISSKFS